MSNLRALFAPKSIAVLGASADTTKLSGRPLGSLRRYHYGGVVYPINPKYQEIDGLPCYPSIAAAPGEIDLAIIPVGLDQVAEVVEQCAAKRVGAAIVLTSGFAETGTAEGVALQERLRQAARSSGMRLVGPNSMGMINFHNGAAANFSSTLFREDVTPGEVGFVSQSGALGAMLFDVATDQGIRYAGWISTGNEADVEFSECLLQFIEDPNVRIIGGYMEGLRNGSRFLEAARKALAARKPMIILKGGRSAAGSAAALSHTGALSGSAQVFDAVFPQAGVLGVDDPIELLDLLSTFERCKLPNGARTAIVTFSGGAGTIIADKCAQLGLNVAPLSTDTRSKLDGILPRFGSSVNPVDLTAQVDGDPSLVAKALEIISQDPDVDVILVFLAILKRFPVELGSALKQFAPNKPLLATWMAAPEGISRELMDAGVALFPDPVRMVKAASGLVRYSDWTRRPEPQPEPALAIPAVEGRNGAITESEAKQMLSQAGLRVAIGRVVNSEEEAVEAAVAVGFPVAIKASSERILHKTDAGLVSLGAPDAAAVRSRFREILKRAQAIDPAAKVLVEEMLPSGLELALGVSRDPIFGLVLMVGFGGVAIEVDPDTALRLLPIDRREANEMLQQLRGFRRLEGLRGEPRHDIQAIVDAMLAVSRLAEGLGDSLRELDVNPLMVYQEGHGVAAADALIVLHPGERVR